MNPIGKEKEDLALLAAIDALPDSSDKKALLSALFKNAVGQYKFSIIDFADYARRRAQIADAVNEHIAENNEKKMRETPEFQIGDIVEILNLAPDQAKYLPAPKDFIGMRYKIKRIFAPKELDDNENFIFWLDEFPINSIMFDTYFTAAQLYLYHRPDESGQISKEEKGGEV